MRTTVLLLGVTLLVGWATPSRVAAQASLVLGGGADIPTGSWRVTDGGGSGFGASPGPGAIAGVDVDMGEGRFSIGVRGFYTHFPYKEDVVEQSSDALGGTLVGAALLTDGSAAPYLYTEVGFMRHSRHLRFMGMASDRAETGGVIGIGAGLRFARRNPLQGFVAAGFVKSLRRWDETEFLALSAGLRIPLGN